MAKPKDIAGQRVGSLTAIKISEEETQKRHSPAKIWECVCDCGKTVYISIGNWGKTQSCGCRSNKSNLSVGDRVGKLTIISKGDVIKRKNSKTKQGYNTVKTWNCQCDCGTYKPNVSEKSLLHGKIKSCGCITRPNKNKSIIENLKYNNYDLSGDYGIGFDCNNKEFYFDLEDYDKIKGYYWYVKYNDYVEANTRKLTDGENKKISLHRVVMDINDGNIHIDHINHIPHDNRKKNLRTVTREQNQANTKTGIKNTSGVKGVYYCNKYNKWVASLQENGRKHSKSFKQKEDAILYRKCLEEKYQKEYSYQNSIGGVISA